MAKYTHKPTEVEAVQWFKHGDHPAVKKCTHRYPKGDEGKGMIDTLEGPHMVSPGDWIVTGTKGEHWTVKPDIFTETYEAVGE